MLELYLSCQNDDFQFISCHAERAFKIRALPMPKMTTNEDQWSDFKKGKHAFTLTNDERDLIRAFLDENKSAALILPIGVSPYRLVTLVDNWLVECVPSKVFDFPVLTALGDFFDGGTGETMPIKFSEYEGGCHISTNGGFAFFYVKPENGETAFDCLIPN